MKRNDHETKQAEAIAYVAYAGELTDVVRQYIETGVKREFGAVTDIVFEKDESLIAGFKVSFEDMVIDGSVRGAVKKEKYI